MRKTQMTLIIAIVLSVFMLSFFMGRATALKDKQQRTKRLEIYSGTIDIPTKDKTIEPASAVSEKVERAAASVDKIENTDNMRKKEPPERMLFPAGNTVLKEYSETAVYSKTMDDWRAHTGIDYSAELKSEVISVWDGVVDKVYKDKLWGYCVEIVHTGDLRGIYRNLEKEIYVKEGQEINKGQVIGKIGKSAPVEKMEEPHLHFELWTQGVAINPESYIY